MKIEAWLGGLALVAWLGGCCAAECQPEALPLEGRAADPEQLFALLQYSAQHDCCEVLYEHLSAATREEHGETKFCLFWEGIEVPDPYDYALVEVVAGGTYIASGPGPAEGELLLFVEYQRDERPNLLARILLVEQAGADGEVTPRVALQEQYEAIESGDPAYSWDAH